VSANALRIFVLALACVLAAPVAATITCCVVDGRRICGNPPPAQCVGRERIVMQDGVKRTIEAPLTAEQRAARAAEEARKREAEQKAREQKRRDQALLASYSNEGEIDRAMQRAISHIEKNAEQARNRLDAALRQQQALEKERGLHANKPLTARLQTQIRDNEAEIAAQQQALADKDAQIEAVRERYEANKQRFRELTRKR